MKIKPLQGIILIACLLAAISSSVKAATVALTIANTHKLTPTITPGLLDEIQGFSDLLGLDVTVGENGLFYFGDDGLAYDNNADNWLVAVLNENGEAIVHEVQGEWVTTGEEFKGLIDVENQIVFAIIDGKNQVYWIGLDLLANRSLEVGFWESKTDFEKWEIVTSLVDQIPLSENAITEFDTEKSASVVSNFSGLRFSAFEEDIELRAAVDIGGMTWIKLDFGIKGKVESIAIQLYEGNEPAEVQIAKLLEPGNWTNKVMVQLYYGDLSSAEQKLMDSQSIDTKSLRDEFKLWERQSFNAGFFKNKVLIGEMRLE